MRKQVRIGARVRFLEPPEVTAWWRENNPTKWHPEYGMEGVVVAFPPKDTFGGPRIRWDNGETTWIGSGAALEVLS